MKNFVMNRLADPTTFTAFICIVGCLCDDSTSTPVRTEVAMKMASSEEEFLAAVTVAMALQAIMSPEELKMVIKRLRDSLKKATDEKSGISNPRFDKSRSNFDSN